jgi:predicted metal-dependent hydrolase
LSVPPAGDKAGRTPAFSVRVSLRARHVRLLMTGEGELVVVVPRRFDQRRIPAIVQAKALWIERARVRVELRRAAAAAAAEEPLLPERIELPAVGEVWQVEYRVPARTGSTRAAARETAGGRLVVTAPLGDEEAARRALVAWLRRKAARELPRLLEEVARLHRLRFGEVTVRHQRTRWGSCSPRGAISLNMRLLFLEPALVDHVLLHELCHTRELNHSQRFWDLLQAHDPQCAVHRRRSREAWRGLPRWLRAAESVDL